MNTVVCVLTSGISLNADGRLFLNNALKIYAIIFSHRLYGKGQFSDGSWIEQSNCIRLLFVLTNSATDEKTNNNNLSFSPCEEISYIQQRFDLELPVESRGRCYRNQRMIHTLSLIHI